jgi:flagellar basal body P-ring formation protein FlgA
MRTRALVMAASALCAAPHLPAVAETLVAARTIRPAEVIAARDVALVPGEIPGGLSDPAEVVGLEARVALYAGRPIRPGEVGPAAIVERNQIVLLVYRRNGLAITTEGRAMGRGGIGDVIRAMNLASRSTVTGMIGPQGALHVSGSALPGN